MADLGIVETEIKPHAPTQVVAFDDTIENADDVAKTQNEFIIQEQERLKNVAQASVLDWDTNDDGFSIPGVGRKWEAFAHTWDETWAAKGYDYFKYDRAFFRDTDEEFLNTWDNDAKFEFLASNGLSLDNFNEISDAVSFEHATDLTEIIKLNKDRTEQIQNALTDTEHLVSSLVTSIADVDIVIGGIGGITAKAIATSAKTSSTIAKITAGSEVGYGAFIGAIDEDTSMAEAMLFSTFIGAIDYSVIKKMNSVDNVTIGSSIVDAPSNNAVMSAGSRKEAIDLAISAERQSPNMRNQKMSEMIDEMDSAKPNEAKVARLQKEIDELDAIGAKKPKTKTSLDEMKRVEVLKAEITKRLKMAKSEGFKQLNQHVKKVGIKLSTKELGLIHQTKRDILEIADDIEMNISYIKKDLEALAKGDIKIGSEVLAVYERLHTDGLISKSAFDQINSSFQKADGKGFSRPKIEIVSNGVNKNMDIKINGKKVSKVGFALGASLAASSAFAYDGTDLAEDAGILLVAGVLGLAGIRNAKTIAKYIAGVGSSVKVAKAMEQTVGVRAKIADNLNKTRTRLTETLEPLIKDTTGKMRQLVDDMYYNPVDTQRTVERIKNQQYHAHWNTLQKLVKESYIQWLKDTGIGRVEGALSLFTSQSKRYEYDKMVTEYIEYGYHADVPSIVEGAKSVNRILDSMMDEMRGAGVKDVDKTTILKNYVPRNTRTGNITSILANATPSSRAAFVKEFSKMLTKSTNPENVAEVYINAVANSVNGAGKKGISSIEDIRKVAETHGFGDDVVNEIADALGVGGDKFGRLKNRIPMDKRMFKGVTIEYIDGTAPYTVALDDIFEQDIMNIMTDYLNKASGQVAFADMGYKSIDEAMEIVAGSGAKPKVITEVMNDIQALSGSPVIDYSSTINKVMRDVGNMVMGTKMITSTISLAPEALATAFKLNKSGWRGVFQNLNKNLLGEYGDDSFMMKSLTEEKGLGLGTHQYGASYGAYKSIDEVGNVSGGEVGLDVFSKVSEVVRDFTLHTLPFVRTSDFLTKVNMQDSLQALYNHSRGTNVFKDYEKTSFAISPRVEELLQRLELNEKGHVKYFDVSKWSRSDRIDLYTTLDAMLQKRIQQSTMGTTASYSRQTALGVVASVLIKFPMSAYSNIGSFLGRGMMAGDANAMLQTSLWFGGAAIGTMARNELYGRDYDENDIMMAALLSHPFAGAYGTSIGLMNPAPTKALADAQEAVNIYNYK